MLNKKSIGSFSKYVAVIISMKNLDQSTRNHVKRKKISIQIELFCNFDTIKECLCSRVRRG